ncbi:MAG: agmatinase [Chloroflexi bacterium]|nr:agmatinase [Chloroflexota bacterium]
MTGEAAHGPWPDLQPTSRTFFGAPLCAKLDDLSADVAFIGVPFDQGTTNRPGARFGPNGVRDARVYSYAGFPGEETVQPARGYYDLESGRWLLRGVTMADCGDVNVAPADVDLAFDRLTRAVQRVLGRGAFPVVVGGDHSVTYPAVRGFDRFTSLAVVHFDAHMDYSHDYQGSLYGHGSPIRRCAELPFVGPISHIGIRTARQRPVEESRGRGNLIVTTEQFRRLGPAGVAAAVPQAEYLYITLDIDVLDPTSAPGTGTPVIGGLTYREVRDCLRELPRRGRVVGMDLVEVAPPYDWAETTARTGAQLIIDLLSVLFPPKGE